MFPTWHGLEPLNNQIWGKNCLLYLKFPLKILLSKCLIMALGSISHFFRVSGILKRTFFPAWKQFDSGSIFFLLSLDSCHGRAKDRSWVTSWNRKEIGQKTLAHSLSLSLSHTEPTRSHTDIVSLPHAHTHIISLSFLHKHTLLVHTRKHLFQNQMSTEFRVEGFWVLPRWQWNRTLNNEQILEKTNKNQESRCENKFMYLVKVAAISSSILINHSFKYLFSEIFYELMTGWLKLVLGYNWTCSWMPFLWELSSFGFKVQIKDKKNNWLKL